MKDEIVRGNCLIAEYMEAELNYMVFEFPEPIGTEKLSRFWKKDKLQYHSSWDWLMPVLKKISDEDDILQSGVSVLLREFNLYGAWETIVKHIEHRKRTGK